MPVKKISRSAKATSKAAKKPAGSPLPVKPSAKTRKAEQARTSGNGRVPAAARPEAPPREDKVQLANFEKAIQLFNRQKFKEAKEWFEKARSGPSRPIAANAELHVRMCDRRLESAPPEPKSAEEHYTYAIALMNARSFREAVTHLETAVKIEPGADHIHYALAVCLGLSGNAEDAYDSLKRAIELQPRNRLAARQDSDLEELSRHPSIRRLLYPES
jgi:tetratricopeptide (TPR) repeat protein